MDPLKAKANFARICQLLVDKGGDALRLVLHAKIYPSGLTTVLNAKKADLLKLTYPIKKPPVINDKQWKLLYPTSGAPADAKNFDITLLTILLTNICALPPPVSGWHVTPPSAADKTISADILRIKNFRNEVYGHIARAEYDDPTFETLWKKISKPLINLGIPQRDIDELKSAYLSPEEKSYIEKLKEWKKSEDVLFAKLKDVEAKVGKVQDEVVNVRDEVVSVKYDVSCVKDKTNSVNDEVVSVKDEVSNVKDEVSNVKDEVVSVKDEVSNVKGKVDSVNNEVVSVKDEVVSVKDEVSNVKDEVVRVKDEVFSVKDEVSNVKDEVVSVKDEVSNVKKKVDSVNDEVVSVKDEVSNVKGKVDSVNNEVVSAKDEVVSVKSKVESVEAEVVSIKKEVVSLKDEVVKQRKIDAFLHLSNVERLAKFNFAGKIESLCERFQAGTREWFFNKLSSWLTDPNGESRAMILIGGPGVGKSVLSAKVCELYKEQDKLAAYHFCDFTNSDSRNPNKILQSLASQMCDNLIGFRDKLTEVLSHEHSRDSLSDAFRVLLHDPIHAFRSHEPMLIVLDALDESKIDDKSEFLELISDEFPSLPKWIKIFISTRPELQVQRALEHFKPLEIRPEHHNQFLDLVQFISHGLPVLNRFNLSLAIRKCQGSFLYAYYLVKELKEIDLGIEPNLNVYVPKGISEFYKKQFKRLQTGFQRFKQGVLKIFINVVAASKNPLPIKILLRCIDLSDENYELRKAISDNMSEILPVYNDCVTIYHKSLQDWMTLDGYEEHAFVADVQDGNERLWRVCETIYKHIDSLESVLDYSLSAEEKFALDNGLNYLETVGKLDNFDRFVNVNLFFLTLKFCNSPRIDFIDIRKNYSELPGNLLSRIFQFSTVSKILGHILHRVDVVKRKSKDSFADDKSHETMPILCYIYLQFLANGYFDFAKDIGCKEKARSILDKTNDIWIEEVAKMCNSNFKIILNAFCIDGSIPCMVSPDKKLLACLYLNRVQLFQLPSLRLTFMLEITSELSITKFMLCFSPDSSYCLFGSIRSCLRITKQNKLEQVPFIPNGPPNIRSISFSSCGNKVVTLENKFIKVWDVRKKDLIAEIQIEECYDDCLFSLCNQYIITSGFEIFDVWDLATLKKLESASNNCVGSCSKSSDSFQIISPAISWSGGHLNILDNHFHLPSGEIVLVTNQYISKPFIWKDRKCVVVLRTASLLAVFDIINNELVDILQIDCLPTGACIQWVSHLNKTNFLVVFSNNFVVLLSFEANHDYEILSLFSYVIKYCSISPDGYYIACCFENGILMVKSIDNGKILKSVLLKQPPEACWWSKLYLWVVCKCVVFKFPYDPSSVNVLENGVEECNIHFDRVLRFAEGILVIRRDEKNFLFKICNEKLCLQQIPDSSFSSEYVVAISSDGCGIVLLYVRNDFEFKLWEEVSMNRWELCSNISVANYYHQAWVATSWLVGTSGSRCLETMRQRQPAAGASFHIIDFSNKQQRELLPFPISIYLPISYISLGLDYFIALAEGWMYFINKLDGKIIARAYLCIPYKPLFCYYLGSRATLVLVGKTDIKFFKIHNIENYIKSDNNTYSSNERLIIRCNIGEQGQSDE